MLGNERFLPIGRLESKIRPIQIVIKCQIYPHFGVIQPGAGKSQLEAKNANYINTKSIN